MCNVRKIFLQAYAVVMLCMAATGIYAADSDAEDHIVAVVNDVPITARQLDTQTKVLLARAQDVPPRSQKQVASQAQSDPTVVKKQVLQQMINQMLQAQIALAEGIRVEDAEVEHAIQAMAQREHVSVAELKDKITKTGMSEAEFKKQLSTEIAINQLHRKQIAGDVNVTDQEIANYLTTLNSANNTVYEYKIMDYRIDLPKSKSAQAMRYTQNVATQVYEQLHAREKQAQQQAETKILSRLPVTTQDLGWRNINELPDVFNAMIVSMRTGEVKGPIAAANGFHVIQLVEKRAVTAPQTTVAELDMNKQIHGELRELIYKRKFEQNLYQWLSLQREHAHIKVFDKSLG